MIHLGKAILELIPNAQFSYVNEDYSTLIWDTPDIPMPTEEEINTKIQELEAAEPLRLLRIERDRLLQETDWRFRIDQNPRQEWYEYCQALRDLPSTAEPKIDENGNLTNVIWPDKPEL